MPVHNDRELGLEMVVEGDLQLAAGVARHADRTRVGQVVVVEALAADEGERLAVRGVEQTVEVDPVARGVMEIPDDVWFARGARRCRIEHECIRSRSANEAYAWRP